MNFAYIHVKIGAALCVCMLFFATELQSQNVDITATVPAICGNGFVEGAEQCDGNALNGKTCSTQDFDGGTLSCNVDCTFNTTQCTNNGGGGGIPPANNPPPADNPPPDNPNPDGENPPDNPPDNPEPEPAPPQDPVVPPADNPADNPQPNDNPPAGDPNQPGQQGPDPGGVNGGNANGENGGGGVSPVDPDNPHEQADPQPPSEEKKDTDKKEPATAVAKTIEKTQELVRETAKKIVTGVKTVSKKAIEVAKQLDEVADNPKVEEATEKIVTPTITGVATAAVVPSLWSGLVPFVKYVFLQPFLLFAKRKRREWGTVYNSLTKLPIDLAMVRIVDAQTNQVKQSRVTDSDGRFLFLVPPGKYKIEVMKEGFSFPSSVLKNVRADGDFADVYHGEEVIVENENIGITPNIPVDPSGAEKTPARIIKERRIRVFQHAVSLSGIILTTISLYIKPSIMTGGFLALHIFLYAAFVRIAKPKKPKGWGIVYDKTTGRPLANAVVRLFTKEYNKLVSMQVTDSKGRYAFLVGPSTYVVNSQKQGYEQFQSEDITVEKKESGSVLKKDVGLKKEGEMQIIND